MVLEKRHSMIRAVFPGGELVDSSIKGQRPCWEGEPRRAGVANAKDKRRKLSEGRFTWALARLDTGFSQNPDRPSRPVYWPHFADPETEESRPQAIVFSGKPTKDEWPCGDTRVHPEPTEAVLVRASWGCGPAHCEGTCLPTHGQWETKSSRGAAKFDLELPPLFEALSHPIFYLRLPALHWNPEKSDLRDRGVIRGF